MTPEEKRLKEIKRENYEIDLEIKELKKKKIALRNEKLQLEGYHKIERCKQAYRSKGKVRVRK